MTKKVVTTLILCIVLFVSAVAVWADYYGVPGKDFNIVFASYVDEYAGITITDTKNDKISTLAVDTTMVLRDAQCNIVVSTNYGPKIRITFNPLKNKDTTITESNVIFYHIRLFDTDEATPISGIDNVYINNVEGISVEFDAGSSSTTSTVKDYKYPLAFKFETTDLDNAVPGDYEATIIVEVISTT